MSIFEFCIKRPVFATVLSLIVVLIGILGYLQLSIRFEPEVFHPHLEVMTIYPGASSAEVEQSVTNPLESALSGTPDLNAMNSQSDEGVSDINLSFKSISPQNFVIAQSQVLQEIAGARLPEQANAPQVFSRNNNANLMAIAFTDPQLSEVQMANYLNNHVMTVLEKVPGVADINMSGYPSALRIDLEPLKMAEYGVSLTQLLQVLNQNNLSFSVGQLTSKSQVVTLNGNFKLPDVESFQNLVIQSNAAQNIKLKDIAQVYVGSVKPTGWFSRLDGKPGLAIRLANTDASNPILVGQAVRQALKTLQPSMPVGMRDVIVFDISKPLLQSIQEVGITLMESILLVTLITFLFLGSLRTTLIPLVTIPVCLIGALGALYFLGFTLNTMTLLALVLAVGLVVDDAIVVMENHHRHLEAGLSPLQAAFKNLSEIRFAVMGMTLALIAVYLPAGFLQKNTTGIYYEEFAYTLAAAVGISGFVALTLSPMMCHRFLKAHESGRYAQFLERRFEGAKIRYQKILGWVLSHSYGVGIIFVAGLILGIGTLMQLPKSFLPKNNAHLAVVFLGVPSGASTVYTDQATSALLTQIRSLPSVRHALSFSGGTFFPQSDVITFLDLNPQLSNPNLIPDINQLISQTVGVSGGASMFDLNNSNHAAQGDNTFYVSGTVSYGALTQDVHRFLTSLKRYPGIQITHNSLSQVGMEYDFALNRSLANQLNVPVQEIVDALQINYGGYTLPNSYSYAGVDYKVILQLPMNQLQDFSALSDLYVQSLSGQNIALSRLLTLTPTISLTSRVHINQLRAGEVDYNIMPGFSANQVMKAITQTAAKILPPGLTVGFEGNALRMQQESSTLMLIFILGVAFIYLVLAALFESFRDPLIILFTVPLCVVGALVTLNLTGGSLNMYTTLGLITLIGLVSKHGVLITQFTHQLRAEGVAPLEALIQASSIRLRPILMTTATMVLGALPLVFASGQGALGRQEIGVVIVAGLLVGTFFSLFVVPVAYRIFAKQ